MSHCESFHEGLQNLAEDADGEDRLLTTLCVPVSLPKIRDDNLSRDERANAFVQASLAEIRVSIHRKK